MINEEELEKHFADYLEGNLGRKKTKELFDFLSKNPEYKSEFEELKLFYENLPKAKYPELGNEIDKNFYDFLEKEKGLGFKIFKNWKSVIRYAAMLVAIAGSYFWGYSNSKTLITYKEKPIDLPISIVKKAIDLPTNTLSSYPSKVSKEEEVIKEIKSIKNDLMGIQETQKKMILNMLKRDSAVDRLFAINSSFDLQVADDTLLRALVKTLDYDPNFNVRLAAVDALGRFNNSSFIRNALVNSLLKQNDPSLQLALIDLLTIIKERKAVNAFSMIIESSESPEYVKEKAEKGMKLLTM